MGTSSFNIKEKHNDIYFIYVEDYVAVCIDKSHYLVSITSYDSLWVFTIVYGYLVDILFFM